MEELNFICFFLGVILVIVGILGGLLCFLMGFLLLFMFVFGYYYYGLCSCNMWIYWDCFRYGFWDWVGKVGGRYEDVLRCGKVFGR